MRVALQTRGGGQGWLRSRLALPAVLAGVAVVQGRVARLLQVGVLPSELRALLVGRSFAGLAEVAVAVRVLPAVECDFPRVFDEVFVVFLVLLVAAPALVALVLLGCGVVLDAVVDVVVAGDVELFLEHCLVPAEGFEADAALVQLLTVLETGTVGRKLVSFAGIFEFLSEICLPLAQLVLFSPQL